MRSAEQASSRSVTAVYTVEEVATILRIGRRQCYELVRSGAIRALRLGRSWRIPESVLRELMEPPMTTGVAVRPVHDQKPNIAGPSARS